MKSALFSPITLRGLTVENRIFKNVLTMRTNHMAAGVSMAAETMRLS